MAMGEPAAAATQELISVAGGQISTSMRAARSGASRSRIASTTEIDARVPFIFQLPATSGLPPRLRHSCPRSAAAFQKSPGPTRASLSAQTGAERPSLCRWTRMVYRGPLSRIPPARRRDGRRRYSITDHASGHPQRQPALARQDHPDDDLHPPDRGRRDLRRRGVLPRRLAATAVATVGSTPITAEQVRSAYQNQLQRYQTQLKRGAHAGSGADARPRPAGDVPARSPRPPSTRRRTTSASRVPDASVIRAIHDEKSFQSAQGQFDSQLVLPDPAAGRPERGACSCASSAP